MSFLEAAKYIFLVLTLVYFIYYYKLKDKHKIKISRYFCHLTSHSVYNLSSGKRLLIVLITMTTLL